jgi:acyl-CoA hydrolase
VMRWIDEAAATCATRWSGHPAVAVYTGGINFFQPIHVGDVVEVEARLIHTGAHSMHLATHVRSGDPRTVAMELTTQCMSVFVSTGTDGRAMRVPALVAASDEDERLAEHARALIDMRAALRAQPAPETP